MQPNPLRWTAFLLALSALNTQGLVGQATSESPPADTSAQYVPLTSDLVQTTKGIDSSVVALSLTTGKMVRELESLNALVSELQTATASNWRHDLLALLTAALTAIVTIAVIVDGSRRVVRTTQLNAAETQRITRESMTLQRDLAVLHLRAELDAKTRLGWIDELRSRLGRFTTILVEVTRSQKLLKALEAEVDVLERQYDQGRAETLKMRILSAKERREVAETGVAQLGTELQSISGHIALMLNVNLATHSRLSAVISSVVEGALGDTTVRSEQWVSRQLEVITEAAVATLREEQRQIETLGELGPSTA